MKDRKEKVEKLFRAISKGDGGAIRELFADDAILIEGALRLKDSQAKVRFEGLDEILGFFLSETEAKDDFHIEATHHIQERDWIASEWTVSRVIDGEPDVRHGVDRYQFSGDRIVYGKVFVDLASLPLYRDK